jgi:hypothetical protein
MNKNYRVNLGFARYSAAVLVQFTNGIILSLTGNTSFPTPPVTLAALAALLTALVNAMAAASQGGKPLISAKNDAQEALVTALRKIAAYVQSQAGQNYTVLLTSGFLINSTNRAQTPLLAPSITEILNNVSTQLTARVTPLVNARSYQLKVFKPDGTLFLTLDSTQARRIVVPGVTPGVIYTLQARAVGGSTGYSPWSLPLPCIAT